ncbi:hypothetical protein IW261DRAFT_1419872 [Armillaria novae-zelandiae]|uniref:Uncharacterized protein n=1 Tax=Armillaria novae-zelandiae TaxID=153914 RepID=A0AA39P918_9AGAR|nr:hypothetical protein IW261DRAFT_1419872 [Armillaria novae-zelandiae]
MNILNKLQLLDVKQSPNYSTGSKLKMKTRIRGRIAPTVSDITLEQESNVCGSDAQPKLGTSPGVTFCPIINTPPSLKVVQGPGGNAARLHTGPARGYPFLGFQDGDPHEPAARARVPSREAVRLQSPIHRLPSELLASIFIIGVLGIDENPVLVSTLSLLALAKDAVAIILLALFNSITASN